MGPLYTGMWKRVGSNLMQAIAQKPKINTRGGNGFIPLIWALNQSDEVFHSEIHGMGFLSGCIVNNFGCLVVSCIFCL